MPLSEPVSYHVKQKLARVLSVFHATPVSVPITDSQVTYLSEHLSVGFMQPGPELKPQPFLNTPIRPGIIHLRTRLSLLTETLTGTLVGF